MIDDVMARTVFLNEDPLGKEHRFPLGGSFVFGRGNVDLFAHVSKTFGDNASPDVLAAALARAGLPAPGGRV